MGVGHNTCQSVDQCFGWNVEHRIAAHNLDGFENRSDILLLIFSSKFCSIATYVVYHIMLVGKCNRRLMLFRHTKEYRSGFGLGLAYHYRHSLFYDTGLFGSDFLQCIAKELRVVQPDISYYRK